VQVNLPEEGWVTIEAETVYLRENFGFAVRFISLSDANRARIERTIERVLVERARTNGGWTFGES
jgi:hypothetical protein